MGTVDRRQFLRLAGGATAMSVLAPSIARAAAIPADRRSGTLRDVAHVVVLMQENRSFDHYFGTMRGVRGYADPRAVTLPSGKPVWYQSDGTRDVLPFHPDASDLGMRFLEDLAHDWNSGHAAFNQGRYDRWVPAKGATTMAYLTRADIPFHYALADAFTVCDAYHCALLGPTDPNRYYMWTGYTGNDGKGGGPVIANDELGYAWTTYPERLERAGVSWKIYQDQGDGLDAKGSWGWTGDAYIGNYGDNSLLYFTQYQNAAPGMALYDKARTGTDAKAGQDLFTGFRADVLAGKLPEVSWIVAPEAFTEHPNWPANYGAWYVAQVLDALTADPAVWSRTVLLVTYDENDGFFDHMVPAFPPSTADQGRSTVDLSGELFTPPAGSGYVAGPYGLGQRVPMLAVSPWSTGGWVCSEVFDHTSIIRFLERRFGVHEPNISAWRRTVCGDLTAAFDFSHGNPRVPAMPDTSGYRPPDSNRHPDYVPTPPAHPALPAQEPGMRPARPLPYELSADALAGNGKFWLDLTNRGEAGASLLVTSATQAGGPWTYTVGSGRQLTGAWPVDGAYDFAVHGPNGFHRRFTGTAAASGPEVTARHDGIAGQLQLVLTNTGSSPVRLLISDGYGAARQTSYRLRPGARALYTADLRRTHGWYDLTVTNEQDAGFGRHLAGHVETGRPSTSDPALGRRP
ncbi:MAG TPA: phospholipase C, phosphocholine-specific [Rugosimonospora sp.]|nr:phospholipase C, phosphocholine-specific [Rugosimonospora sp.]